MAAWSDHSRMRCLISVKSYCGIAPREGVGESCVGKGEGPLAEPAESGAVALGVVWVEPSGGPLILSSSDVPLESGESGERVEFHAEDEMENWRRNNGLDSEALSMPKRRARQKREEGQTILDR